MTELTKRQQQVLELAALGIGDKEIAHAMGISTHTVKSHMTALREKLDITDTRVALVLEGIRLGLVEVDGITRTNGRANR